MDIKLFTKILGDKSVTDYKKMKYKYGSDFDDFLKCFKDLYYVALPLKDFEGENIVFAKNHSFARQSAIKLLLKPQKQYYSIKAAQEEILASSAIESIDFSRDSVRNVLKGFAPKDEEENRILGVKKGLEFISDLDNKITEENIYTLYMMTVGNFLEESDKLSEGEFYRHDSVFVVSSRVEHHGLSAKKIPEYMQSLVDFINSDDDIDDLIKGAIIHFYFSYIHPYFDGNGRMARLLHLWFLIQKGYQSVLFVAFSSQIEKSRKAYYDAYTLIEENKKYSKKIDVTPFILYFTDNVYNKMKEESVNVNTLNLYDEAVKKGKVTKKETELWQFVLSNYALEEFSTKQLEKDFVNVAYATVRDFVLKFEELGLLSSAKYSHRVKYKVAE